MRIQALRTVAILALIAACVALPASLVPRAEAAFPGVNGKIAFERGGDIYVMNPDGSGERNITNSPTGEGQPAWSSDGQRIAFVRGSDIYVMKADGSELQLVTQGGESPTWSPDGNRLAFLRSFGGPRDIFVVNVDGSGLTNLTNLDRGDSDPAWSPDGQRIAFWSTRDHVSNGAEDRGEIYTMNSVGGDVRRLTNNAGTDEAPGPKDELPSWSPDGQKIAFVSDRDGLGRQIYVMNANGSGQQILTNDPGGPRSPAWSPDGESIAFESFRDGSFDIFVISAAGTRRLANPGSESAPDWQPLVDTDGDGLLDTWETGGIDIDADGTIDLDLPAMGADPRHKDIFLEIDHMAGHALLQAAVDNVVAAFAAAPVSNPDEVTGVTLHVDNGSTSTMNPLSGETWGALSDADTLAHQAVLGTYDASGRDYLWAAFLAIKAVPQNFAEARKRAFHYVISGHRYGAASNNSAGISRGIGASDLLVTLGPASEPAEGSGTVSQQAAVLMHELGHNLGLGHGGSDDTNRKPSYLSIMNYAFLWTGLPRADGTFVLDYSRLPISLDENNLDEDAGFGFDPASEQAQFRTAYLCPGSPLPPAGTPQAAPLRAAPIDWDCDSSPGGVVSADINADGQLSTFTPFLDWPALVYDGGAIGDAAGSVVLPQTTQDTEPQLEELLAYERALKAALDTTAPELKVPADLTVDATGPAGATVSFSPSASDDVDPSPTIACVPASGSVFPIGTTVVNCTATDDAGNSASGSFTVRVRGAAE